MLRIRQVNEQQINAALNDIDKSIGSMQTEAASVKKSVAEENKNTQKVIEGLSKRLDNKLSDLDSAIGNNIEYINNHFVPNTRTVNGKSLSNNIELTASDVGAATVNDITNAINDLDVASAGGAGKYISEISESNGKISATATTMDTTPTANSTNAVTSGGIKSAIDAAESNAKNLANATGTLPIANGGTGATTGGGACTNLIGALEVATGDVTDNTDIITSNADGYAEQSDKQFYKRKGIKFWNYIKAKISSVLKITLNKHTIQGSTVGTNTFADTNPKVVFNNVDGSQAVSLTFTDYDSVQAPASLTLNGNQGGEYFIAPNFRAIGKFKGVVEGASYRSEAQSSAKLKIKINSTANWMLCFTVVLYQGYRATKIMISGYQYGSNYWYEPEAVLLGDSNYANAINVYFGYDSANNLWVGLDQGNFTGIAIVDVVNGYKAVSDYSSLFTITSVSSLGGTTQKTVTAYTPKKIPIDNTLVNGASGLQFGQFSGSTNNPSNDWYHHLYMNHANGAGYVLDFALCFHSDTFSIRRKVNGSWSNWVNLIHSGNIGSQSVNYASSSGTATTANRIRTSAPSSPVNGDIWIE